MKKPVVILIAIIYVASIALVSFYGLKFKVFEEVVDVEKIEILNTDLMDDKLPQNYKDQGIDHYVVIRKNDLDEWRYHIEYRVFPDNATKQEVSYVVAPFNSGGNEDETPLATVDENGVVVFSRSGAAKISLIATDGTNAEVSVLIIAR